MVLTTYIFSWLVSFRGHLSRGLIWQNFLLTSQWPSLSAKCSLNYIGLVFPSSCCWWPRTFHCVALQGPALSLKVLPRASWVEKLNLFAVEMCCDKLVSQREMPHGSTGSSGSGREFQRWMGREDMPGETGFDEETKNQIHSNNVTSNMRVWCSQICPCN